MKRFQKLETIPNQTLSRQLEATANWRGACDRLKSITQPTLVIVGTDDAATLAANSLIMTWAWLVQMKGAGHGLMYQYPEQLSKIVETFLENTKTR